MPVAIVIGCAPVVMFTGPQKLPIDLDEMAVAGGLAGAPYPRDQGRDRSRRTGRCRDCIEALIDPELLELSDRSAKSHGHVALEDFNMFDAGHRDHA